MDARLLGLGRWRYFWHRRLLGPHIGYYGGINYGFGYFGTGFYGGYWNGGRFWYNRAYGHFGRGFRGGFYNRTYAGFDGRPGRRILRAHAANGLRGSVNRQPSAAEGFRGAARASMSTVA